MAYGSKGIFQLARSKPEINYTGLDEEELKDDLGIIDTHLDYLEKGLQEIKEMEEIHPGALKLFGTEEDRMGELKVDAMAMVLERCRPGRVQQILGKTKLNYFGHRRILYPSDDLKPSPEDLKIFKDIFFSFHSIARTALIIGQGRDSKGRKYICCMLGKRTRDNPAPGETLGDILKLNGSIYLFEDGTFGNTLPEEYKEEKNKEKQPKKKGFFQKIIWIERRKIMPKRKCDVCGKEKDVKGGKICSNGHFICAGCVYGGIFGPTRTSCPLCGKPLR